MTIIYHPAVSSERVSLESFADSNGLVLHMHARSAFPGLTSFLCHFDSVEIVKGQLLRSTCGEGNTASEAMADYAARLSQQTVRIKNGNHVKVPQLFV